MRTKLAILTSVLFAIGIVAYVSGPLIGQCDSGIKKEHLDPDAGAFVDGSTIQIDGSVGLKVAAIPDESVTAAKIDSIFGAWTDKDNGGAAFVRDAVYKANCDGFVGATGEVSNSGDWSIEFSILVGDTSSPTTARYYFSHRLSGSDRSIAPTGVVPIRKGEYFKVTYCYGETDYALTAYWWIPIGSGACVKQ